MNDCSFSTEPQAETFVHDKQNISRKWAIDLFPHPPKRQKLKHQSYQILERMNIGAALS